jgi:hypothetical protein
MVSQSNNLVIVFKHLIDSINAYVSTNKMMTCVTLSKKKRRKKCKISSYSLSNLQLILFGIQINSEVPMICQKYKSLPPAKFR